MEVGPFPSFIVRESAIVRGFVEARQPLGGLAIFDAPVRHRRRGASTHPSALSSGLVRIPTFFGLGQIIVDVPRHLIVYNGVTVYNCLARIYRPSSSHPSLIYRGRST